MTSAIHSYIQSFRHHIQKGAINKVPPHPRSVCVHDRGPAISTASQARGLHIDESHEEVSLLPYPWKFHWAKKDLAARLLPLAISEGRKMSCGI